MQNLIKKYSVLSCERLKLRLIKSNKTYRSYKINRLHKSHVIYISLSNDLSVQKFRRILIVYRKMCQFHVCTTTRSRDCPIINNKVLICSFSKYYYISLRKHWPTSGGRSNLNLTNFPKRQSRSIEVENIYMKIITRLSESLNNTSGNFCPIRSNEVSVSS